MQNIVARSRIWSLSGLVIFIRHEVKSGVRSHVLIRKVSRRSASTFQREVIKDGFYGSPNVI
jgi:hypothetical protein